MLLKGIFIFVLLIQLTYGFPDGAGLAACMNMLPAHGSTPQITPAPYTVTPSATNIRQGDTITVTIARTNTSVFLRGFMILARNAANNTVGQFFLTTGMRLLSCPTMPSGSVATHSINDQRNSIILSWTPPTGFTGNVVFHVTAVNNISTFWTGLTSPTVNVTP